MDMKHMCHLRYVLLGCLALLMGSVAYAENLLTNPGWDGTTGSVTLGEGQAAQFDSTTFTDWQVFSVGAGTSTFSVEAKADAVSAPNVMSFTKNLPDDAGIRRDSVPATVTPGHCYMSSAYGRDVEGYLDTLTSSTFIFGPNVSVGAGNMVLSADWSKFESSWICPASGTETSLQASFQFRLYEFDASVQLDSCSLEDITSGNRMTNSGFENSADSPVLWDTFAVSGDSTTASISNDSYEGNNALLLERTAAGGDAGISKDGHMLSWNGSDVMEISLYLKDDPTIATGEKLLARLCCWDATGTIVACQDNTFSVGSSSYKLAGGTYTPPSTTVKVSLSLRIVNSSGAAMTGDVLIDNVVMGDLTAGFVSRLAPDHTDDNLLTNPGWDLTTASITLENNQFDSGVTFPDWQIYAVGDGVGSTFTSQAAGDAISSPNVFVFSKNVAGGDSACRRDTATTSVYNGFAYKYGVYVRDTDSSATNLSLGMVLLGTPNVSATGVNLMATSNWELAEDSFIVPTGYSTGSLQLRVGGDIPAVLQLDSAFVEDITEKDRMTNGGFENSDSSVLLWDTFAAGGDTTTATISNDAHDGDNALLLQRTSVTGGDAGINKDGHLLPWNGSDRMEVTFYAKDEPTLATGESLLVMVCYWNSSGAIVGCQANTLPVGATAYKLAGAVYTPDATTAKVTVGFRIVNSSGAAMTGDVLIDDVVVGDLDAGFLTRLLPDHTEGNILTNPGWDLTTATITLDNAFDSGVTFPDWQIYAIPEGVNSTFTSEAATDAISAPNVFTFTRNTAGGDSACRRDSTMTSVTPSYAYKYGVYVRDTDTNSTTMNMGMVLFPSPLVSATGVNLEASTAWELAEDSFLVDGTHSLCSFQLRMSGSVPASLQFDSAFVEDVSEKNRMTNSGFENSDSRVLLWDTFAVGGDNVTATVSNDSFEGDNALLLQRTSVTGGDSGINKDSHLLPWDGDDEMEVSFYAKDQATVATGEYLLVMVCCWDSNGAIVGCEAYPLSVGASEYEMNGHVYAPPANTAKVTVGFRIVDVNGAAISGDVLIDDVVVGDLDDGFTARLKPTAIMDWAQY